MISLSVQRVDVGVPVDTHVHLGRLLDALELLLASLSLRLVVWCPQYACILIDSLVHWRCCVCLQCVGTWHSKYLLVHVHGLSGDFVDLGGQGRLIAISYRIRGRGEVDTGSLAGAIAAGYFLKKNLGPPANGRWLGLRGDRRLGDLSAHIAIVHCRLLTYLDALTCLDALMFDHDQSAMIFCL